MDPLFTIPLHFFLFLNSIPTISIQQQQSTVLPYHEYSTSVLAIATIMYHQTYSLLTIFLSLVSGAIVGFSLGLIGGGGSILAVPLLIYVVGVTDAHIAIGTSALAVGVNAVNNLIHHYKKGNVKIREGLMFAIPGVIGSIFGSQLGLLTPSNKLLILFGIFMIIISILMLRKQQKQSPEANKSKVSSAIKTLTITTTDTTPILKDSGSDDSYYKSNKLDNGKQEEKQNHGINDYSQIEQKGTVYDNKVKQLTIGFLVGLAAGYFGIGGGFIIVPSLMHLGLNIIDAIGTSLIPVSMFGFSTAIRYSLSNQIEWVIALLFIIGGIGGGMLGTKFAAKAPRKMLTSIFAFLLIVVAIYIILKSVLIV
jgi:uncharacterized protein